MSKKGAYLPQAEQLYVHGNKTIEEIAKLIPVSANSLYKWALDGDWATKRRAALASPRAIADKLRRLVEKNLGDLKEEALDAAACDGIYKLLLTIQRLERMEDLRVIGVQVMDDFTKWLRGREISPEELQLMGSWIRAWFRSLE